MYSSWKIVELAKVKGLDHVLIGQSRYVTIADHLSDLVQAWKDVVYDVNAVPDLREFCFRDVVV